MIQHHDHEIDGRFGDWLHWRRRFKDISLARAAVLTGVTPGRIKAIEHGNGKGVTLKECTALSQGLNISLPEMVKRAGGAGK